MLSPQRIKQPLARGFYVCRIVNECCSAPLSSLLAFYSWHIRYMSVSLIVVLYRDLVPSLYQQLDSLHVAHNFPFRQLPFIGSVYMLKFIMVFDIL